MENPYIKNPLYVAHIDPKSGNYIAAYFFLGNVPKDVLIAANNRIPKTTDPRIVSWNSKDSAVLEKFYGKGWKKILTAENPIIYESIDNNKDMPLFFSYTGGKKNKNDDNDNNDNDNNDNDNNDNDNNDNPDNNDNNDDLELFESSDENVFDVLDDLNENAIKEIDLKLFDEYAKFAMDYKNSISTKIRPPKYLPISVFPEDTIYDLRLKIYLATGIDFYRQHMFYYVNGEGPAIPYQFNIDNIPVYINYKDLYNKSNTLCGIHVDSHIEKRRDGIQITALDTFIPLQITNGVRITATYIVDLYNVFIPLDYSQRPIDNLLQITKDAYQFDILYYGIIIKYWPQLSKEITNIALSTPNNMSKYLLLSHDIKKLEYQFSVENEITNMSIKMINKDEVKNKISNISITGATIKIFPKSAKISCLIRNIFDYIETNDKIIMVNAKFNIESALLSESGMDLVTINERQGEFISISGLKRYITSNDPKYKILVDWFLSNKMEINTIMIAVVRDSNLYNNTWHSPFIYLTLYANGQYSVSGEWLEDSKISFEQIIEELNKTTIPIIKNINSMGTAVFPLGGSYNIISNNDNDIVLGSITGSIFYPKHFTDIMFKALKKQIKILESASIVKYKNIQNPEIITFAFLKGIVSYDLKLASRTVSANYNLKNETTLNQYAWMHNSLIANRWNTSFSGRLVRIYHRATDIKIEIINADNINEFKMIKNYILACIDGVYNKEKKIVNINEFTKKNKKKLKKLQENDPNLFDLKKYDPKNKVYSVLCQSDRQPVSYEPEEIKNLTERQKSKLIKYWNFTKNTPAYYECPHVKFPHLSFRPDQHPMGYCLPCCNMALPPIGSKSMNVYKHCLEHKKGDIQKIDEVSKHVLTYGKFIQQDRVSEIGKEIKDELFLGVFNNGNDINMYLIGVEQYLPSVDDAGFTYSIIYLIKLKNQTIDDKIKEFAEFVRGMKDNYYQLGNGAGMAYKSSDDLADDILNIFIHKKEIALILDKSCNILKNWKLILIHLVKIIHNINIITFIEDSEESFYVEFNGEFIENNDIIFVLQNNNGSYPIVMTNIKVFIKQIINLLPIEDICTRQFNIEKDSKIYNIIYEMHNTNNADSSYISDIHMVESQIIKTNYKIVSLLINFKNYCYGLIILNTSTKNEFYLPIQYSNYYSHTKYKTIFENINESHIATQLELQNFLNQIFDKLIPNYYLINLKKQYIGFKANNICYFHKESNNHIIFKNCNNSDCIKSIIIPYSIIDINNYIIKYIKNDKKVEYSKLSIYKNAIMRNRLYRYFLAEFSSILKDDKNIEMRKKIISIVSDIKFDNSNSLISLRIKLLKELKDYKSDLITLKEIISKSILLSINNPLKYIIQYINNTNFNFDKQLFYNLKEMDNIELIDKLKKLLKDNIEIVNSDVFTNDINNIYVSCGEPSNVKKNQCVNNKLTVPSNAIDDFYYMLCMDIKNPIKTKLLTYISSGIFDSMEFINRDNEILEIFIEN
jgi:hypothetical protein